MFLVVLILYFSCGALAHTDWDYLCEGVDIYKNVPHPYDCGKVKCDLLSRIYN